MTPNWKAVAAAGAGAAVGGVAAALVQGYRNKPLENAILITASLGAIVGAAFAPRTGTAPRTSFPPNAQA